MKDVRISEIEKMILDLKRGNPELYGWDALKQKEEFLLGELASDDTSRNNLANENELKETRHCMDSMKKYYSSIKVYEAQLQELSNVKKSRSLKQI